MEEFCPKSQKVVGIQGEHLNGHAADWRSAYDTRTLEFKMLRPEIGPRMKQTDQLTGVGIQSRDVGAFVAIAMRTSECEIAGNGFPTMLLRYDMIHLKGQRQGKLRNAAIFAVPTRSLPNGSS